MRRSSDTLAGVLMWHASQRRDAPWLLSVDEPGSITTISCENVSTVAVEQVLDQHPAG